MSLETISYDVKEITKNLVTEDDEPVDNIYSAKQQRLLVEPLYGDWIPQSNEETPDEPRPFLADANVGIFYSVHRPPLVPDMFLSLDVQVGPEWNNTSDPRSYFTWEFGKVPEVVVEIVSNYVGNEISGKLKEYARMGVTYYVVYDPWLYLGDTELRVYELSFGKRYRLRTDFQLPEVSLSLSLWQGVYESIEARWLRWCDNDGNLIPTAKEYAQRESERAHRESERAQHEADRAQRESERAERLAAKLRELGVDPEQV